MITLAETGEMREYISNSKKCKDSLVPNIVNSKVKEYEINYNNMSQANKIRSLQVLYRKYTSIRNSCEVLNESGGKREKH